MKKNSSEYRLWKKKNDEKKLRNRKKSKKSTNHSSNTTKSIGKRSSNLPYKVFVPPKQFSILNNPAETINFFNYILDIIKKIPRIKNSQSIYLLMIDMTEVQNITGDALMYLLTVMKNTKMQQDRKIIWKGNFPKDEKFNQFLRASGFLKYMKTAEQNLIHSDENFEIQCGKLMQGDVAKYICDFTNSK